MRVALGSVVTAAGWAAVVVLVHRGTAVPTVALVGALWLVTAGLTWWATRGPEPRRVLLLVGLAAVVVQLPGLLTPPLTSSDAYRYVWDGRVQLSGTSPYRYAPLDDRLASLRDPVLFPGLSPDGRSGYLTEPVPTDRTELVARAEDDPRTRINRPRIPTIYPPVAQAWFTAVAAVTPWSAGTRGLQVGSALLAVAVAVALAAMARRAGRHPRVALWWAWSPLVLLETGNGAHVDVVSAALLVGALAVGSSSTGRRWVAGVVVGLAAAVKLFPLVVVAALAPAAQRRWWRAVPAPLAAVTTLLVTYLPHVLVAGTLVLGYIPGYLLEEGSSRSAVLQLLLPAAAVTPVAALLLTGLGLWSLWWATDRSGARDVAATAVPAAALVGGFLLVTTPAYPWYAVPLVVLAVLSHRLEWVTVAIGMQLGYAAFGLQWFSTASYAVALAVVVVVSLARARAQRRRASSGSSTATPSTHRTT